LNTAAAAQRPTLSKPWLITSWVIQIITAAIFLQTLFFKFTGAPESIYIFETLGLEPWGRIGSGIAELIASVLLLMPGLAPFGALLGLGVISGAIMSHLTKLGIVVQDDGGLLFILALVVLIGTVAILAIRHREVLHWLPRREAAPNA
jgi:putative oxidoreductase